MTDLPDLIADPSWLPHRYDAASDRIQFVRMDAATRAKLTFLADHQPASESDARWIAGEQIRAAPVAPQRWNFIFHSAFARSTLLARAFEQPGLSVGYSEPAILNDLSAALASPAARATLVPVVDLLARPHGAASVVIKPSNVANGLIATLLTERPQSRAILLSTDLEGFLASIAKKGLMGRRWARRLHLHIGGYAPLDLGLSPAEMHELTDLQVAGLAWLMHQRHFAALLDRFPAEQLATLASEAIGAEPARTIAAVAGHFGIDFDLKRAEAVAAGPLFARHAKLGTDYTSTVAREEAAAISPIRPRKST